jgi:hypothetical protein
MKVIYKVKKTWHKKPILAHLGDITSKTIPKNNTHAHQGLKLIFQARLGKIAFGPIYDVVLSLSKL